MIGFLGGGKYLTFPFSSLSSRVALTLGQRKSTANQLPYQTSEGWRCTGYLRKKGEASSSLIAHLVADNLRGIPNSHPRTNLLGVKDPNEKGIMVSISFILIKLQRLESRHLFGFYASQDERDTSYQKKEINKN